MVWKYRRMSWKLCSTGHRKENGAPSRETRSVRESSVALISFLRSVGLRSVISLKHRTCSFRFISSRLVFLHRCSEGVCITGKLAGLPFILHRRSLPHRPQHHPQTAGESLLQVKRLYHVFIFDSFRWVSFWNEYILLLLQADLCSNVGGALHRTQRSHLQWTPKPDCSSFEGGYRCPPSLHWVRFRPVHLLLSNYVYTGHLMTSICIWSTMDDTSTYARSWKRLGTTCVANFAPDPNPRLIKVQLV